MGTLKSEDGRIKPAAPPELGKLYGKLSPVNLDRSVPGDGDYWLFACDCGRSKVIRWSSVRRGLTKSCGCAQHTKNVVDMRGKRFGMLTVVERVGSRNNKADWLCQCDCGETRTLTQDYLARNIAKDCGCQRNKHNITHGCSGTQLYHVWEQMVARCKNPKATKFKDYGGRGISVCQRWLKFENFLSDMGDRPFPGAEIDRKENDGNYEPGNVRWTTRQVNMSNTRVSRLVTHESRTQCVSAWARELGMASGLLGKYIISGMTIEQVLARRLERQAS